MGVYNRIPELSGAFIGDIDVTVRPALNVDGDLIFWDGTAEKWKRIAGSALSGNHNHDDRYFREDEHIDSSAGSADAGKPIKLDSAGRIPQSMRHLWDLLVKTADYVMTIADEVILADATAGAITITLPPVFAAKKLPFHIKRINTNNNPVTIVATN